MANSIRARLVSVALGALVVACCSRAAPISNDAKLHLAAAPEDFKALGIGKEIEVREDGRRTPKSSDYFEWCYFDGLFDDGRVFVVWFGDNWLYGWHKRALNIDLPPPGKPTRHIMRTFDDPGVFSSDHADVQIGPHSFKGDLETYAIHVDATETGGAFRAEMKSCRRAARATSAIARAQGNRPPPTGPTTLKVVTDGLRAEYCQFEEIVK